MTGSKPKDPFRRFHRSQCTLYPRVWCESCNKDGFEHCIVGDHKIGVCDVCGERGTNAHTHVWSINSDALAARLRDEFSDTRFTQTGPIAAEGQWRSLTGDLFLDGRTHFCVGQATTSNIAEYGPRTLYTRAIKDGAARAGLLPPNPPKETDRPLQPLLGAALTANTPEKPASRTGMHFSEAAVIAANRNSLKPSVIRDWAVEHYGDAKGLGQLMGPMLLTLTHRIYGAGYEVTDIDVVADLIFENQPPPTQQDEEE